MKSRSLFIILVIFYLSACTPTYSPTIDIQVAVEKTLTAISMVTMVPSQVPSTSEAPIDSPIVNPTVTATEYLNCIPSNSKHEIGLVTRVVDGDTIDAFINDQTYTIRYIGIDAPETKSPDEQIEYMAPEATAKNFELVDGKIITLVKDKSETDSYGRLLRYVYVDGLDGIFVNYALVRLGYAYAITYQPDTACDDYLYKAEQIAKKEKIGLWAEKPTPTTITDTPSTTVPPNQVIINGSCSQFNAPGNDNDNKNEEYVCFTNHNLQSVDMTDWSIMDEYGWTYRFPSYIFDAGSDVRVRTGCGTDTKNDLYWCKDETAVWNNDGDCVYLFEKQGVQIDEFCY